MGNMIDASRAKLSTNVGGKDRSRLFVAIIIQETVFGQTGLFSNHLFVIGVGKNFC